MTDAASESHLRPSSSCSDASTVVFLSGLMRRLSIKTIEKCSERPELHQNKNVVNRRPALAAEWPDALDADWSLVDDLGF